MEKTHAREQDFNRRHLKKKNVERKTKNEKKNIHLPPYQSRRRGQEYLALLRHKRGFGGGEKCPPLAIFSHGAAHGVAMVVVFVVIRVRHLVDVATRLCNPETQKTRVEPSTHVARVRAPSQVIAQQLGLDDVGADLEQAGG